jgi:hypothetical protein
MKRLVLTVALVIAAEARAGFVTESGGSAFTLIVGGVGFLVGGATAVQLGSKSSSTPPGIVSLVFAVANVVVSGIYLDEASKPHVPPDIFTALALVHASIALFDCIVGMVGISSPPVEPTVVSGIDAHGQTWAGLGVRVGRF